MNWSLAWWPLGARRGRVSISDARLIQSGDGKEQAHRAEQQERVTTEYMSHATPSLYYSREGPNIV